MARISFTFKKPNAVSTQGGSTLQDVVAGDDDSALKGDNYVSSPNAGLTEEQSFFDVRVIDYDRTKLTWGIGAALTTPSTATPVPTEVVIRYDTIGEPQTVANGVHVTTISPDRIQDTIFHGNLPEGTWIYYSLFVRYEGIGIRSWYEKVADLHVLTPTRYGSTDMLYRRIPRHYRIQDGADSGTISVDSELFGHGPLYRMLNIFGWDIDRLRTLIHHQMVGKDPMLATSEALDQLAYELGIQMTTIDLGTERLRNIVNDIGYLRQKKGTLEGVREWLTAISGCNVEIKPSHTNYLTNTQSTFSGTVTNTTDPTIVPTGNTWVVEASGTTGASSANGLVLTKSSGSTYTLAVVKAEVADVKNSSWYRVLYDITNQHNASVSGFYLSPTNTAGSVGYVDSATGFFLPPEAGSFVISDGVNDWIEASAELGLIGDGTYTTTPMYLHIYVVMGPYDGVTSSTLTLNNLKVYDDDRYPYEIDIYSQRVNLFKDPKFFYGSTYWTTTVTAGSATAYYPSNSLGASTGTSASVSVSSVDVTPVRLGLEYFLSIQDKNQSITSVELHSTTHGLLASSSSPYAEVLYTDGSLRRTWLLQKEYEAPWLPLNIDDCFLTLKAEVSSTSPLIIKEPLFEALYSGSDYFDGDNENGGWLAGETASAGVADYRWGDSGQHISFSYFTSDYQRTVATLYRLLDTIIPVTQTAAPETLLNLDRIYGYSGTDRP